jgi:hypothetical protein
MSLLFTNPHHYFALPQIISGTKNKNKNKKSVSFSNIRFLHIIPNRLDLVNASLLHNLWWSNNDYLRFRNDAFNEIRELQKRFPNINLKQSLKLLYQPDNIRMQ